MRRIKFVRRVVVILAIATPLMSFVPAQAAVRTHTTFAFTNNHFHGKVTSSKTHCIVKRTVNVFQGTEVGLRLIGTTLSGRLGGWTIHVTQASSGDYFARMPAQTRLGTVCKGTTSIGVTL